MTHCICPGLVSNPQPLGSITNEPRGILNSAILNSNIFSLHLRIKLGFFHY